MTALQTFGFIVGVWLIVMAVLFWPRRPYKPTLPPKDHDVIKPQEWRRR